MVLEDWAQNCIKSILKHFIGQSKSQGLALQRQSACDDEASGERASIQENN
jgi:hypothetical protein